MTTDFIFSPGHNCHIAGGMMVDFSFTVAQLCCIGIGMLLLLLLDD